MVSKAEPPARPRAQGTVTVQAPVSNPRRRVPARPLTLGVGCTFAIGPSPHAVGTDQAAGRDRGATLVQGNARGPRSHNKKGTLSPSVISDGSRLCVLQCFALVACHRPCGAWCRLSFPLDSLILTYNTHGTSLSGNHGNDREGVSVIYILGETWIVPAGLPTGQGGR